MITGKDLINEYQKMYSENEEIQEEKLYSTGDDYLDDLLEKAFCEGYEYAQKEFANQMGARFYEFAGDNKLMGNMSKEQFNYLQKLHQQRNRSRGIPNNNKEAADYVQRLRNARNGIGW